LTFKIHTAVSVFLVLTISWTIGKSQSYEVGDTLSLEHQNLEIPVCAGGSSMRFSDYNHALNGGEEYLIWLDIFAPT